MKYPRIVLRNCRVVAISNLGWKDRWHKISLQYLEVLFVLESGNISIFIGKNKEILIRDIVPFTKNSEK